ncbi:MAG: hypothetical protein M1402_01020 [Candidatus Thermoplasmatota archaeon]|nr:hypothetical protein [Candidatus Thermoplasmatota archaeon]
MSHYSYVAIRSMLRRLGVLSGDRRIGYTCLICQKDIKSTNHFFWVHPDYFQMAREAIDNRNFNIQIEA